MTIIGNPYREGFQASVGSGTTNVNHILEVQSGTEHLLKKVKVNIPGVSAGTSIVFYDGAAGTGTKLTGSIPMMAQPDEGFDFRNDRMGREGIMLNNGSLGIQVVGNSQASKTIYVLVDYWY